MNGPTDSGLAVVSSSGSPGGPVNRTPGWVVPMVVLALVAGLGIGMALGVLIGGRGDSGAAETTTTSSAPIWEDADAYGAPVEVTGQALPLLGDGETDPAVGMALPRLAGTDYAGNSIVVEPNGKAKLIVALAHWCPYCNAEVPILQQWYADGVPDQVEVVSLSVYADESRANFPPATWLEEAGWRLPLLADDEGRTLVRSLGIPAVPFWLLVAPDGTVVRRVTGQIDAAALDQVVDIILAGAEGTTIP